MRTPNYDKFPSIPVPAPHDAALWQGWEAIAARLAATLADRAGGLRVVAVECYPGVHHGAVAAALAGAPALQGAIVVDTHEAFRTPTAIDALVAPYLGGDDPVFGYLCTRLELEDFLEPAGAAEVRARIVALAQGADAPILVVGPAATLLAPPDALLVYADMPRWEGQLRQRRNEVPNLGVANHALRGSLKYKRAFFVDWRVCDRLKQRTMERWDFLLDTTAPGTPRMTTGAAHLATLAHAVTRPFRVVPFFDPGPWGGQWMKQVCDLDRSAPNYAWCFDCVPEENSLLLAFADGARLEIPAINLVFRHPRELLGEPVHGRFGAEFPIRFDFLDTIGGGNLSFQVHPPTAYAHEQFGLRYTQDESYYMLDAAPDAVVYLGCRDGTRPEEMLADLAAAQRGEKRFDDARFAARFPAKKHDHFLIPAGTLHCSGAGGMVLEISATPYIFTFKLWDWARLGLDSRPRPVHLGHGARAIQWERDETYARTRLINQVTPVARGGSWREERTGLHEAEFIETRRHWFTGATPHHTGGTTAGGVHVLNLVEGEEAVVESPDGAFAPFTVHYAETFIVPAAVGAYTIRPVGAGARQAEAGRELATMKAFVRTRG
jgi:mannose-6-phosphate isomerase class I